MTIRKRVPTIVTSLERDTPPGNNGDWMNLWVGSRGKNASKKFPSGLDIMDNINKKKAVQSQYFHDWKQKRKKGEK